MLERSLLRVSRSSRSPRTCSDTAEPARSPRPENSIGRQPVPPLEPPKRALGRLPEATVEVARPQPVPAEQELEDADVVTAHASPDEASAEERPPARAERGPRSGAGEAVDGEVVAALEGTHGAHGARPLHTVDRAPVQPVVPKRDLEPRDLRVEPVRRGSEQQRRQRGRKGESQAFHPTEVGRGARISFLSSRNKIA
jgi:hypothetical protein